MNDEPQIQTTFGSQEVILIRNGPWWKAYPAKKGQVAGRSFYQTDSRASAENFTRVAKEVWEEKERNERKGRAV